MTLLEKSSETYSYLDNNFSDLVDMNLALLDLGNELDAVEYSPEKLISTVDYRMEYSAYEMNTPKIQKSEYFYSSIIDVPKSVTDNQGPTTGIKDRQNSDFNVYPNPATSQVAFTWKAGYSQLNLKIYQLTGACVIDREIFSHEVVHLKKLNTGVYLYKLADKNTVLKSGKLVIK